MSSEFDRRNFLKKAAASGIALGAAQHLFAAKAATSRVVGANDRINLGIVGVGGRGSYLANKFSKFGDDNPNSCQIVAVCDVYEKRKREAAEKHNAKGYLDYREVIARPDIDAVDCRNARPLACQDRARRAGCRQRRVLREADDPHHR